MLSIVIVNYRTWDHIERNLASLLASLPDGRSLAELEVEMVVVDNHSDDGRLDDFAAKHPELRVIESQGNYGYSHGCNQGARAARGDWLLFMNPDVVCDWVNLAALWQAGRDHPDWAILTAPQYDLKGRLQRSFAPFTGLLTYSATLRALLRRLMPTHYPDPRTPPERLSGILEVDWVTGSLVLMSRQTFEALGGWDEDYWLYCEDEDICRRAHDRGMKVGYFPTARFVHSHAASTRRNPEIKALTKSETILSKYLYLSKHEPNLEGALLRLMIRSRTRLLYPLLWLLDAISFGKSRFLHQRRLIQQRLWHYFNRTGQGGLLSDRSIHFSGNGPDQALQD